MKASTLAAIPVALSIVPGWGAAVSAPANAVEREDGAVQLNIQSSGSLQNPAFSPDGRSILFTGFRNGYNKGASDLFLYNLATGKLKPLVSNGYDNVNLPGSVWNGAIRSVVFSSEREEHDEIFVIADSGMNGSEMKITHRPAKQSFEPSFSPDGQWIVFESHDLDVEDDGIITKFKIDGSSEYIDLTAAGENAKQPNWSPGGNKILYQSEENGKWAIWTMDIDGTNKTRITSPDESNTDGVFSQDGRWIIYSSENNDIELANIYKIPADGGSPIRLTSFRGYDDAPSISPDGSKLAFEYSNPRTGYPTNREGPRFG